MPMMDLSRAMQDPRMADRVTVYRQTETVSAGGIASVVRTEFPKVIMVITAQGAGELIRRDDGQQVPRKISAVTKFRLRPATPGFQPDIIEHQGAEFLVSEVLPYHRFGPGFIEAIAVCTKQMPDLTE